MKSFGPFLGTVESLLSSLSMTMVLERQLQGTL